ncbi:N-acyl-D-amino-acid deacylase family protein [Haladaptatus sp. NG-WS-4]
MNESIEFQNATVVDGTGQPPYTAHVLITGETIRRIGDSPVGADREIDLDGGFLAPGFIDMHAHSELRLFDHPDASEKLTQGVTLEVMGQDGVSVAPVPEVHKKEWGKRVQSLLGTKDNWSWNSVDEFLDELDATKPAVNCAYYAPHGNLRSTVAGFETRELDAGEIDRLCEELRTALDQGAFAMSKGMIYPPSSYGRDDEFVELAQTLGERNSFMVSHVWNETDHVVESIKRYIEICEEGGCQPHISHLKVGGNNNWGKSEAVIELFDTANKRGLEVTFDQYPYTAGSTMLTALLPPWAREGSASEICARLQDYKTRMEIKADIESDGEWENLARAAGTWKNILITHTASGQKIGETVAAIATQRDIDPIDAMCDLLVKEELDVTMADFIMAEEDIQRFLADERGTICSDGIFGGKPHPRAIGTFARIFERYVKDREVFSIETAVYKTSGHAATVLGLSDRGFVAEGYHADLVAFDLESVQENGTYQNPLQLAEGIQYVLVNGIIAVEDGHPTEERAGTVLRSTEEWKGSSRPQDRRNDIPT